MKVLDTRERLSVNTIVLHWAVGIMMIGLLGTGLYMAENEFYALYPWHKSFGVLIVAVAVLRIVWRIRNRWPLPVGDYTKLEKLLAKIVHHLLIIGTVLMPVSGFMMSAMGGHGVDLFGLELIARNPSPDNPREVMALNSTLAELGHTVHSTAGCVLIVSVILHIMGALKHHFLDKDGTLRRMLGAKV